MKTPEDIINRFINEENVKFNQERDDWMIEAMEEYAKLYHENEVKKLNIPDVMVELPCDEEIEQQARKVNEGDIDYGYVFGAKWMRGLAKGN